MPTEEREEIKSKEAILQGGIRNGLRKQESRHPVPVITLSNVRDLNNKPGDILLGIKHEEHFGRTNLLCFRETWLNQTVSRTLMDIFQSEQTDIRYNPKKTLAEGFAFQLTRSGNTFYCL